jgi:predicted P-loop ATPase
MTGTELITQYQNLGFRLVYWTRFGSDPKKWKGPIEVGWNDPSKRYPIEAYDPTTMNVGTITGHEIAPGKFLADVDVDWPGGLVLAARLLPSTGYGFGRLGKKLSHAFFTTPEALPIATYDDVGDDGSGNGERFVELRSGNSTHQTMIAPSLHSPGVYVECVLKGNILHVECKMLQASVLDFAIGCLLLKRVPNGLHHDGRIALCGYLLKRGLPLERVKNILEAVCLAQATAGVQDMTGADVDDVDLCLRTTVKRISENKKVAGGPKFAEFIGGGIGKAVVARLDAWFGQEDGFIRDEGKIVARNQQNIRYALEQLKHAVSYNQFSAQLLLDDVPLEKKSAHNVYLEIEERFRFSPPIDYFRIVLENLCWQNQFHPVKQYLDALTWDGVPRIDTWLTAAANAANTPYTRAVSAIMLIAGVRRVRAPGCKYDEMVVWESPQGGLKSSAAQALCPKPAWFSDDLQLNMRSQQLIEATLGKWIVEASDLAGKRKTEIEQLKAMLSRQVDGPARMAYEYFPVERPRHFILIGTTNSSVYLTDPTGARRFWPVVVGKFDVTWIIAHRDQLWAEACVREAAGASIRLPEDLWPAAAVHQESRREIDPWEDLLRTLLIHVPISGDGKCRVATDQLWDALGIQPERRDRYGSLRISDIMQRLGFTRTRVRDEGCLKVGFMRDGPVLEEEHAENDVENVTPRDFKDDVPF